MSSILGDFHINIQDDGTWLGVLLFIKNLMPFVLFLLGCIFLYYSSESFIDKSILISQKLNISSVIIGASVIALGTSLPELLVSLYSIFMHNTPTDSGSLVSSSIIIGNIMGSNIANVALVLGFCSFLYKMTFKSDLLKDLVFIFLLGSYVIFCIYYNVTINYIHGILLIGVFIYYFYYLISNNQSSHNSLEIESFSFIKTFFILLISIIGLSLGTNLVVDNALEIAYLIGISELHIGFSIVALGTSLPELFPSQAAIKRKQYDLLIGNVIGSNILNVIFVLGIASLFTKISIDNKLIYDINLIAIVFTLSHLILLLNYIINKSISKFSSLLLLFIYAYFIFNLF